MRMPEDLAIGSPLTPFKQGWLVFDGHIYQPIVYSSHAHLSGCGAFDGLKDLFKNGMQWKLRPFPLAAQSCHDPLSSLLLGTAIRCNFYCRFTPGLPCAARAAALLSQPPPLLLLFPDAPGLAAQLLHVLQLFSAATVQPTLPHVCTAAPASLPATLRPGTLNCLVAFITAVSLTAV